MSARDGRLLCSSCGADLGDADDPYRDPDCWRCIERDARDEVEADLRRHDCREAGESSWIELDGRGIELCRVCDVCREAKLSRYRPEILRPYSQADVDEPIEANDWGRDYE